MRCVSLLCEQALPRLLVRYRQLLDGQDMSVDPLKALYLTLNRPPALMIP